jgi:hypothetical protein
VTIHCHDGSSFPVAMTGQMNDDWRDDVDGVGWQKVDGRFTLPANTNNAALRTADGEFDWSITITGAVTQPDGEFFLIDSDGTKYVIAHGEPRMPERERQFLVELADDTDAADAAESE